MTSCRTALLFVIAVVSTKMALSFSPSPYLPSSAMKTISRTKLYAMERLHDPSANAYGKIEHVYSLRDMDVITRKIADDEWTGLGSVIAESMYETILDVGADALGQRGWVERMSLTEKIAEEVSSAVQKTLYKIRTRPTHSFDQGPHSVPEELLTSLQKLLRHELGTIIGLDDKESFDYNGRDLSLIVLSSVSDAIESYCRITNINAPFFNLATEMEHRIRDRRKQLLLKHSKGYENVKDIAQDIEQSREQWVRDTLGKRAARTYEFGEVTTHAGNAHGHREEKRVREGRRKNVLNALFQDFDGVLMP